MKKHVLKLSKREKNIEEYYSPEMIDYNMEYSETIPYYARFPLSKALSLLPHKVIDYIVENYIFISEDKDEKGCHWTFDCIWFKNRVGFILLATNLWDKEIIQIDFTIAHEVAHAWKKHKILNLEDTEVKKGIKREKEADKLAVEWLKKYYNVKSLKIFCYKRSQFS